MGVRVVEGRWEDVAKKVKLAGRKVRVVFRDDSDTVTLAETVATPAASPASRGAMRGSST